MQDLFFLKPVCFFLILSFIAAIILFIYCIFCLYVILSLSLYLSHTLTFIPRRWFSLVSFDNYLYAFGGCDGNDRFLNNVERYDGFARIWTETDVMPAPRKYVKAAVFEGCN
jgi:ABC-type maltose transport system permease subunit